MSEDALDDGAASDPDGGRTDPTAGGASDDEPSREALLAELELRRERNQRLRESYARAQRSTYRRTALGLFAVGLLALAGGALLPDVREVLVVLGAIGVFAGLVTYYLTPERFVAANVGRSVFRTAATDRAALVAELGLSAARVYVPTGSANARVRLFVPQYEDYALPDATALTDPLVVPDVEAGRGATFTPTGSPLYEAFLEAVAGRPADAPGPVVGELVEACVEQFDVLDAASADVDADDRRATVALGASSFGPATAFDHPVVSVVAVGLARTLDAPVTADVDEAADDRADYRCTFRWAARDDASADG